MCRQLYEMRPKAYGASFASQINCVTGRLGHDGRYAIDLRKLEVELGWMPAVTFDIGIHKTADWYLDTPE